MKAGIPREIEGNETRVALTPDVAARLANAGLELLVESNAGETAFFSDDDYRKAGVSVVADAASLYGDSDIIVKVHRPIFNEALGKDELDLLPDGKSLIAMLQPLVNRDLVARLAEKRITSFSMDAIPRIARAQRMDVLSSMSSLAGYKAVLVGAGLLGKYLPMMMTAAATMPPARVLVLGAGVAGLQAIATAHRLGAIVEAFDVRPVVKEQVESLGATFIMIEETAEETEDAGGYARELTEETQRRQRELIAEHVQAADLVITTAMIPGRPAPVLVTREMVESMKAGTVIVDLAAETGGNCELTVAGEEVVEHGTTIAGPLNLASSMPLQASQLFARNVTNLLLHLVSDGELKLDFEDSITDGCCITHAGEIRGQYGALTG